MKKIKQNRFLYGILRFAARCFSKIAFKPVVVRNELKGKKGPFVVIANHQCASDFVNAISLTKEPMHFVISHSFYNTLPVRFILTNTGMIDKNQFQTSINDVTRMRAVLDNNGILALYPSGLMCEDGLATPTPKSTYQFLKWLGVDVYVIRSTGTYFVSPKWAKGLRRGRTYLDAYKLISRENLADIDLDEFKNIVSDALDFDAYREQEERLVKYKNADCIEGLENVLYKCPHCSSEFFMAVKNKSVIYCKDCGYEQTADEFGFLHKSGSVGEEIRYPSDWSKRIYEDLKHKIDSGEAINMSSETEIHMIDYEKHKYVKVGDGVLSMTADTATLTGVVNGEKFDMSLPINQFPSLPFKPGKYIELQHGKLIYRCVLKDGQSAMKYINIVKIAYSRSCEKNLQNA